MANYTKIYSCDIVNGEGIRTSVFFSGCPHRCKGCFNEETWDKEIGKPFTFETICEILQTLDNDYTDGVSVLGGEPLAPYNIDATISLCQNIKIKYPNKTIWLWTGYKIENLNDRQKEIFKYVDIIIDGPFVEDLKDLTLDWRGSSNQRILKKGEDF